jgi:type II secretory pathway component PulJ
MRASGGTTLTDLLVGTTVGALVLVGLSTTYVLGVQAAAESMQQTRLNQELREVLELISQDSRRAGYRAFPPDHVIDPTDNPFQSSIDGVDNDLHTGSASGEASASCVLYSYDLNANGRIGVCDGCSPQDDGYDSDLYDGTGVEMFGFQLKDKAIRMRVRRAAAERAFDCNSGRWESLTGDDVRITRLHFAVVAAASANLDPEKAAEDACATGDTCRVSRVLEVLLTGELAEDPAVRQTLEAAVAIRNDRYFVQE